MRKFLKALPSRNFLLIIRPVGYQEPIKCLVSHGPVSGSGVFYVSNRIILSILLCYKGPKIS